MLRCDVSLIVEPLPVKEKAWERYPYITPKHFLVNTENVLRKYTLLE